MRPAKWFPAFLLLPVAAGVLVALALSWASGVPPAHAAPASPLSWGARVAVDTTDGLGSVSCPTASLCVAGARAQTGDGAVHIATTTTPGVAGSWTVVSVPVPAPSGTLVSMSCPSASLCVAVDGDGHILSSTNPTGGASAWRVDTFTVSGITPRSFTSVSCSPSLRCAAIDSHNAVLTTTTPASGNWTASSAGATWARVSCTDTLCAATNGPRVFTTTTPTAGASSWTAAPIVPFNGSSYQGSLSGVSCIAAFCVVADAGSATVDTGVWTSTHPLDGAASWTRVTTPTLDGITCVQGAVSNLCAGWTVFGAYVTATTTPNGTADDWVSTANVADGAASDQIADVSCPTVSMCVAVTSKGAAVVGSGGAPAGGPTDTTGTTTTAGTATSTTTSSVPSSGGSPTTVGGSPGPVTPPASGYVGAGLLGNDVYAVTGNAVSFALSSANDVTGSIAAATAASYAASASRATVARAKRKPVVVGSARFTLTANVTKHVRLVVSKPARRLLAKKHSLKVTVTITSRTAAGVVRVRTAVVTLTLKKRHR